MSHCGDGGFSVAKKTTKRVLLRGGPYDGKRFTLAALPDHLQWIHPTFSWFAWYERGVEKDGVTVYEWMPDKQE
jgi:hypothetical protein